MKHALAVLFVAGIGLSAAFASFDRCQTCALVDGIETAVGAVAVLVVRSAAADPAPDLSPVIVVPKGTRIYGLPVAGEAVVDGVTADGVKLVFPNGHTERWDVLSCTGQGQSSTGIFKPGTPIPDCPAGMARAK